MISAYDLATPPSLPVLVDHGVIVDPRGISAWAESRDLAPTDWDARYGRRPPRRVTIEIPPPAILAPPGLVAPWVRRPRRGLITPDRYPEPAHTPLPVGPHGRLPRPPFPLPLGA